MNNLAAVLPLTEPRHSVTAAGTKTAYILTGVLLSLAAGFGRDYWLFGDSSYLLLTGWCHVQLHSYNNRTYIIIYSIL